MAWSEKQQNFYPINDGDICEGTINIERDCNSNIG